MTATAPPRLPEPPAAPDPYASAPPDPEALIKEARRRARRRRLAYAGAVLALIAIGLAAYGFASRGGTPAQRVGADRSPTAAVAHRVAYANGLFAIVERNDLALVRADGSEVRRLSTC